jgi:hypothetical protein
VQPGDTEVTEGSRTTNERFLLSLLVRRCAGQVDRVASWASAARTVQRRLDRMMALAGVDTRDRPGVPGRQARLDLSERPPHQAGPLRDYTSTPYAANHCLEWNFAPVGVPVALNLQGDGVVRVG